mmetsp:Transcript_6968/g.23144  ORF Transcript_6968/g.23144 Transcript_6968/m.23144 type:complete len:236 (-) Transcript_6968:181-888(-)
MPVFAAVGLFVAPAVLIILRAFVRGEAVERDVVAERCGEEEDCVAAARELPPVPKGAKAEPGHVGPERAHRVREAPAARHPERVTRVAREAPRAFAQNLLLLSRKPHHHSHPRSLWSALERDSVWPRLGIVAAAARRDGPAMVEEAYGGTVSDATLVPRGWEDVKAHHRLVPVDVAPVRLFSHMTGVADERTRAKLARVGFGKAVHGHGARRRELLHEPHAGEHPRHLPHLARAL